MPDNSLPQPTKLTRSIKFIPGYDKTKEGFGSHPPEIMFTVTGPKGAINWTLCTGWYFTNTGEPAPVHLDPYSVGIYTHEHPTQSALAEGDPDVMECELLGGPCCSRYLGSHTDLIETLKRQGEEPIFALLELTYAEEFKTSTGGSNHGE